MSAKQSTAPQLIGLVLAAGRAQRMQTLKQTLPWTSEGSSIISSAFDAIAPYCQGMYVVLAEESRSRVAAALGSRSYRSVLSDSCVPMFDSVLAGINAIRADGELNAVVLLQPGDHPQVARSTVELLLAAHCRHPLIAVIPEYQGKGGHPAIIPCEVATSILKWNRTGGLRQFWIEHPHMRTRLAVDDPLCTLDLDTPADYVTARTSHQAP